MNTYKVPFAAEAGAREFIEVTAADKLEGRSALVEWDPDAETWDATFEAVSDAEATRIASPYVVISGDASDWHIVGAFGQCAGSGPLPGIFDLLPRVK